MCCTGVPAASPRTTEAVPLVGGMLLVSFASGEKCLFDTTRVSGPAFSPLRDGSASGHHSRS